MATYVWRCEQCGEEWEQVLPIGTAQSMGRCGDCGGKTTKVLGVGLALHSDALPGKLHGVRATNQTEARWDDDMPAYARMRRAGLAPPSIDGCARMEDHVGEQADIDHRAVLPEAGKARARVKEQIAEIKSTMIPHPKRMQPGDVTS